MSDSACILVVDDDPGILRLISDILSPAHCVYTHTRFSDAIHHLDWEIFDLLLIDLHLPPLNLAEAIRTVRALSAGRCLPVLVLSELERSRDSRPILDTQGILRKPFTSPELLSAVHALLKRSWQDLNEAALLQAQV